MIEIRRAELRDKPRIVEISSKVWDGEDYLPYIFEKWVAEEGGEFSVITVDDVVAGCAKMTQLPDGVLWLEGIRVDTDYRGRGLGKKMAEYQLKRAREIGYKRLELSTFVENYESLAIIEKRGFERVASFKFLLNPFEEELKFVSDDVDIKMIRQVMDIDEVRDILSALDTETRQSYVNLDWTFLKCDESLLKEFIKKGLVYKYEDTVFAFGNWGQKDDGMTLYFMLGDKKGKAIKHVLLEAKKQGVSNVIIMSTGGKEEHELLYEHGFVAITTEENDAFVYRYAK